MLEIVFAEYGNKDVTAIVKSKVVNGETINITAGNILFGDPQPFTHKYLSVDYKLNGTEYHSIFNEEDKFVIEGKVDYIPISCKCITYGRVEFLEESIESFLRQEYAGDYELVIINDYPLQKLHFDHPKIRIYNLDFTFNTIGEKENFAISSCKYDNIAVWDDDDLAMPNHLSNINKFFPNYDLIHWKGVAFISKKIASIHSLGNSGIIYSRNIWQRVGGHAFENAGYDTTFVQKVKKAGGRIGVGTPSDEEVSWFYTWGNGSYHMSGLGADDGKRPNVITRHSDHIENLRRKGLIPIGDIELRPNWKQPYDKMLKEYCNGNH